jgi:hypothetical protein
MKGVFLFLCLLGTGNMIMAQGVTRYVPRPDRQYVSVFADLNQNMTAMGGPGTNKSRVAPFVRLGFQYRYQFTPGFFLAGGVAIGNGNFAYRYRKTYAPTSDTTYAKGELGSGGLSVLVFEPHIEVGKVMTYGGKHQITISAGVSLPMYLPRISSMSDTTYSTTVLSTKERVRFGTTETISINNDGKHFGVGNANLYLGYKRLNYNALTNKLGLGLIFSYSFYTSNAGLAVSRSYNVSYKYEMGNAAVQKLTYASFGIRLTYDLL